MPKSPQIKSTKKSPLKAAAPKARSARKRTGQRPARQTASPVDDAAAEIAGASLIALADATPTSALVDLAAKHVFATLSARSNVHGKPAVCFQQYSDGSWTIHHLVLGGGYDGGTPYFGPTPPAPICGGD